MSPVVEATSAGADDRRRDTNWTRPSSSLVVGATAAVVALALGWYKIGRSFDYDESVTYAQFVRGGSIEKALTTQFVLNNHPMASAIQALVWRVGFVGETSQRAVPVAMGAVAVGLTAWAVTRRVGVVGGLASATFLVLNPMFIHEFRLLRGYSLATVAVVVAALAARRSWDDHRVRWLTLQGTAMFLAVAAHAYSVLPLVMVAVVTLALGRSRWAHVITWSIAACCAIALRLPILGYELEESRKVGRTYRPAFPRELADELLGRQDVIVWISFVLSVVGIVTVARRSVRHAVALGACVLVFGVAVLAIWQVAQPTFLFTRFFVTMVPFVAVFVGIGTAELPRPVGAAIVPVLMIGLWPTARTIVNTEAPFRDGAAVADAARAMDQELCGYRLVPMATYTTFPRPISAPDDFDDCEVFISLSLPAELRAAATDRFESSRHIGGSMEVWGEASVLDRIMPPD